MFACLVLLSHAAELTDGNKSREIFARLTGTDITFGTLAVDGFFLLSGYLITRSWLSDPDLWRYLQKRCLRILPGYLVAVFVSTIAVGLLAPAAPHFFHHLGLPFLKGIFVLAPPITPPVLPGQPYPSVNGALWTINYEFRCYLLVALAGMLGLLRRPKLWLLFAVVLILGFPVPALTDRVHSSPVVALIVGTLTQNFRIVSAYVVGPPFIYSETEFGSAHCSA